MRALVQLFLVFALGIPAGASTFHVFNHSGADLAGTVDDVAVSVPDGVEVLFYGAELDLTGRVVVTLDDAEGYQVSSVLVLAAEEIVTTETDPREVDMRKVETSLLIVVGMLLFIVVASAIRIT